MRDAVLRLYRSAHEHALAEAGRNLGALEAPALVVWGMRDRYIPGRFGRLFAQALPNAELIELPRAGHWPWLDEPATMEYVAIEPVLGADHEGETEHETSPERELVPA